LEYNSLKSKFVYTKQVFVDYDFVNLIKDVVDIVLDLDNRVKKLEKSNDKEYNDNFQNDKDKNEIKLNEKSKNQNSKQSIGINECSICKASNNINIIHDGIYKYFKKLECNTKVCENCFFNYITAYHNCLIYPCMNECNSSLDYSHLLNIYSNNKNISNILKKKINTINNFNFDILNNSLIEKEDKMVYVLTKEEYLIRQYRACPCCFEVFMKNDDGSCKYVKCVF
jgi:hypothetical protein